MKKVFFLIIILTLGTNAYAQVKQLILGKWDLVEEVRDTTSGFEQSLEFSTQDEEDLGRQNKNIQRTTFHFTEGGKFEEIHLGSKTQLNYRFISDEIVVIGETTFKILQLSPDILKIQQFEEMLLTVPDILVFQKRSSQFKPIAGFKYHVVYHENGQKKEAGQLFGNTPYGIWREWYENGQQKNLKVYVNGVPTGTWKTWDKNGKLIKEEDKDQL